jgi:hypothetical protein
MQNRMVKYIYMKIVKHIKSIFKMHQTHGMGVNKCFPFESMMSWCLVQRVTIWHTRWAPCMTSPSTLVVVHERKKLSQVIWLISELKPKTDHKFKWVTLKSHGCLKISPLTCTCLSNFGCWFLPLSMPMTFA